MRSLCKVGLVLSLVALMAAPAFAQRRPGGGGFGQGQSITRLLGNEDVQKDIKLDKDQTDKVKDALTKFREDHKDEYTKLFAQDTKQEERTEILKKLGEEGEKAVKDLVKPEQMTRLKQLQVQSKGIAAFNDEEVGKTLKLTAEQKDDLKKLGEDTGKDIADAFKDVGMDQTKRQEAGKKVQAISKEAMDKATKMLKDDQQKLWKELTGAPFEGNLNGGGRRPGGAGAGTRTPRPNANPNPAK